MHTQPATQPRDDFYRVCGIAFALILAVVLVVAAPGGRPVDGTMAGAQDASAEAVGLMVSAMESGPLVDRVLRGEAQAYGF